MKNKEQDQLAPVRGLLIDLDGTLYQGGTIIAGADALIRKLRRAGIPFLFVTNNSSRTPEDVAVHLREMGIEAQAEEVCTSSQAAARYISEESPGARVAILGEEGLRSACKEAGLEITEDEPQYVVQGIDRSFTYESLARASRWIQAGAGFILTNPDLMLPTDGGIMPGAGTLGAAIEAASGVKPVVIGKPNRPLVAYAAERLGIRPEEGVMVGDNLRTDIAAGVHAGCTSILVLTGITNSSNLERYQEEAGVKPDYICSDLEELAVLLNL